MMLSFASPRLLGEADARNARRVRGSLRLRGANESKTERARSLRAASTDAESVLWYRRNYRILRFWNNDVSSNLVGVLETIVTALAEAPPHPDR